MKRDRLQGFTLIELLTVIAIIAILAGFVAIAVPRALERAKIARAVADMKEFQKAMTIYYGQHGSYPPAYGFISFKARQEDPDQDDTADEFFYHLKPLMSFLNLTAAEDMYDEFGESGDSNRDGRIGLLEFSPIGQRNAATNRVTFPKVRYNGNNLGDEVAEQLKADTRPYIYIPVNLRQFRRAKQYWVDNGYFLASAWDDSAPVDLAFPPSNYDAYVLISVGPGGSTFGVIPDPLPGSDPLDVYHLTALRAFFLATRDLNGNGQLDLEFRARSGQNEAALIYEVRGSNGQVVTPRDLNPGVHVQGNPNQVYTNQLPDPKAPSGYGPLIEVVGM